MVMIELTKENFQSEAVQSEQVVLVDFWADWCGPCRMLSPVVEQYALDTPAVKVGKVNVDEQMDLAMQFGVSSIPTLIVFRDGVPAAKAVGVIDMEQLKKLVEGADGSSAQ
ncbi:MAG: thioredoxin [Oscillospiraceae bacterium]|nr:thioredoxin [Oscillospiraceae bacterium]